MSDIDASTIQQHMNTLEHWFTQICRHMDQVCETIRDNAPSPHLPPPPANSPAPGCGHEGWREKFSIGGYGDMWYVHTTSGPQYWLLRADGTWQNHGGVGDHKSESAARAALAMAPCPECGGKAVTAADVLAVAHALGEGAVGGVNKAAREIAASQPTPAPPTPTSPATGGDDANRPYKTSGNFIFGPNCAANGIYGGNGAAEVWCNHLNTAFATGIAAAASRPAPSAGEGERGDWFAQARKTIDPMSPATRIWGKAADLARAAYASGSASAGGAARRWPEGRPADANNGTIVLRWLGHSCRWEWAYVQYMHDGTWWLPQPPPPADAPEAPQ